MRIHQFGVPLNRRYFYGKRSYLIDDMVKASVNISNLTSHSTKQTMAGLARTGQFSNADALGVGSNGRTKQCRADRFGARITRVCSDWRDHHTEGRPAKMFTNSLGKHL